MALWGGENSGMQSVGFDFVSKRRIVFSVAFALFFALFDTLAQVADVVFSRVSAASSASSLATTHFSFVRFLLALFGSAVVAWGFLALLDRFSARGGSFALGEPSVPEGESASALSAGGVPLPRRSGNRPARSLALWAFFVPLLCWVFVYLYLFPLASMNDTTWILWDPLTAASQHPLVYNLAISVPFKVSLKLFGTALPGIVLVAVTQMLAWAGSVAFVVRWLERRGTPRALLWALIAYVALNPLIADYSFAVVKDSPNALFVLLLVPALVSIWETRGASLSTFGGFFAVLLVLCGFGLTRNNAIPIVLVLLAAIIWWSRRFLFRSLLLALIASIVVLLPTALVDSNQRAKEALSVPLQNIGYAMTMHRDCLPAETVAVAENLLPSRTWSSAYNPKTVDRIKYHPDFNLDWLNKHKPKFIRAWAAGFKGCYGDYLKSYLVHASQAWRFDANQVGVFGQSRFNRAVSNLPDDNNEMIQRYAKVGVVNHSLLPSFLRPVGSAVVRGMELVPGAGTWGWVTALAVLGLAYRRRRVWVPLCLPVALIWGTLLVAAPTMDPFRYFYSIVFVAPLAYVFAFSPGVECGGATESAKQFGAEASPKLNRVES